MEPPTTAPISPPTKVPIGPNPDPIFDPATAPATVDPVANAESTTCLAQRRPEIFPFHQSLTLQKAVQLSSMANREAVASLEPYLPTTDPTCL